MKRSLKWHKDCLRNMREHAQRLSDQAQRMEADADDTWRRVVLFEAQIARAEGEGRTEFDRERFNVSRKPKQEGAKP
jgi:branched-subunit amino acid aminotransferase/4-amino-4-deoxychorismate lyase